MLSVNQHNKDGSSNEKDKPTEPETLEGTNNVRQH
jgi:hypothetical protein